MAKSRRLVLQSLSIETTDAYEAVLRVVVHAFSQDCSVDLAPFVDLIGGVILRSKPLSELDQLQGLGFTIEKKAADGVWLKILGGRGAVITGLAMKFVKRNQHCMHRKLTCRALYRRGANSGQHLRRLIEVWGGTDPVNEGIGHMHQQTIHPPESVLWVERALVITATVNDVADAYYEEKK